MAKKKKQTQVHNKTKKVKENIFSWYQNGYLFHKIWIEIKSNFDLSSSCLNLIAQTKKLMLIFYNKEENW